MLVGIDARLIAYQRGGISTYTLRLLQALQDLADGDQFTVLQSRRRPEPMLTHPAFRTVSLWTPPHHPWEQWSLPLELAFQPLDLLHSPDFIPPLHRRCPAVITVHDLAFLRFPDTQTSDSLRYYRQVNQAVENAEGIITVSEATRRDMVELLGCAAERVDVVHHGVDARYRPLSQEAARRFCKDRGLPETFVLWVGTLEPRKNLAALFRAFAALKGKLPPARDTLVLAGPVGWRYEETAKLFDELGLAGRTVFFGPATEDELAMLYNAAWAFAFPSLYEGFGLPPLEAMACGTPVVASDAPALPEVLGDAALYVPPHDDQALAAALLRISHDTALAAELSRKGLARAAEFSWRQAAQQTLAIYHRVADAAGTAGL